ncbi:MAG TPA: threonine synthase [Myxococcales bacterium]|nr:threonine synthase [Myxococcales bacterium]
MSRSGVLARWRDRLPVTARTPALSLGEGDTPLVAAPALARDVGCAELWLKVEGQNPTGSFKDRGMVVAVAKAAEAGARVAACASTGNTSASAAAYCAAAGIACRVVVPEGKVALAKLAQAVAHGARIVVLRGNFDAALSAVRSLAARGGIALLNSVNPYRLEGQKTAAFEIVETLSGPPDGLALPVGNAGNISAYWRGFVELGMRLPVYGIQAAGAAPLVSGAPVEHPETLATAIRIGNPASWTLAVQAQRESGGQFAAVPDEEIVAAYSRLAAEAGVFCEPASAAPVAGLLRLSRERPGRFAGQRLVAVLTGHGLKDPQAAIACAPPLPAPVAAESIEEALR